MEITENMKKEREMKAEGGMGLLTSFGAQSSDGNKGATEQGAEDRIAETDAENNEAGVETTVATSVETVAKTVAKTEVEEAETTVEADAETEGESEVEKAEAGTEAVETTVEAAAGTEAGDAVVENAAAVDIEALVAEAEARGYERGRNEGIEAWMRGSGNERYGAALANKGRDSYPYESEVMILNNMRPSIWEQI